MSASASPSAYAPPADGLDPRTLWPNILEAVKNRRRFTWILLSQNAQVTGFDGTTLQLGFVNAGARDNFSGSGSEDVLKQALAEQFNVQWNIEAIVDPSGGSAPPPTGGLTSPTRPTGSNGGGGGGANYAASAASGGGYGNGGGATALQHSASPPPASAAPTPSTSASSAAPATAPNPAPQRSAPEPPPPVSIEDDIPEDDDPDLDESALSGHDLIVRELGATVVEEFSNE